MDSAQARRPQSSPMTVATLAQCLLPGDLLYYSGTSGIGLVVHVGQADKFVRLLVLRGERTMATHLWNESYIRRFQVPGEIPRPGDDIPLEIT